MARQKKIVVRSENKIQNIINEINSDFGEGTFHNSKTGIEIQVSGVYSTGFETIDQAWGKGGIPWGRITVLHGKEGGGKTTIALTLMANAQKAGAFGVYVDAEFKLNLPWARICGIDLDDMVLSQPDYLEKAISVVDASMQKAHKAGLRSFVVLDSMNACDTKAEYENDYEEEEHYGPKAKVWSRVMPKLARVVKDTDSTLVLISQIRGGPKGDHIACGNAPKFYSSCIASFSKPFQGHKIRDSKGKVVAVDLEVEFIKNQVSQPYRKARFRITPEGPDFQYSLIEAAADKGIMSKGKSGSYDWSRKGGDIKFRGVNGWLKQLKDNPKLEKELRDLVRSDWQ